MVRSREVLPFPFGPNSPTFSSELTCIDRERSTSTFPYPANMLCNSNSMVGILSTGQMAGSITPTMDLSPREELLVCSRLRLRSMRVMPWPRDSQASRATRLGCPHTGPLRPVRPGFDSRVISPKRPMTVPWQAGDCRDWAFAGRTRAVKDCNSGSVLAPETCYVTFSATCTLSLGPFVSPLEPGLVHNRAAWTGCSYREPSTLLFPRLPR